MSLEDTIREGIAKLDAGVARVFGGDPSATPEADAAAAATAGAPIAPGIAAPDPMINAAGRMPIAQPTLPDTATARNTLDDLVSINPTEYYNNFYRELMAGAIPFAHQGQNLVRGTPQTNVNRLSHATTLRNSRLADVLNNRYYLQKDSIGMVTNDGAGGGGIQGETALQRYRMPIETEEMRQMKAIREREMKDFERSNKRKHDFMDQSQLLSYAVNMSALHKAGQISDEYFMQNTQYAFQEYANRYRQAFEEYLRSIIRPGMQMDHIMRVWNNPKGGPILAGMLANIYQSGVTMPSWDQYLFDGMVRQIIQMQNNGVPLEQQMEYMIKNAGSFMKSIATTSREAVQDMMPGGAGTS